MHPDMVTPIPGGELLAGRHEIETGAGRQLGPELLGPELLDQVAHPSQSPALAVAELAEELGDGPGDLDGLVGSYEDVDIRGHALTVGEAATGQDVEPERPVAQPVPATSRCLGSPPGHSPRGIRSRSS